MLSDDQVRELCARLGCPPQVLAVIAAVQQSPPARRLQNRAGNVSVRFPSRKMGVVIQAESHHNELAAIYAMEHDSAVTRMVTGAVLLAKPMPPPSASPTASAPRPASIGCSSATCTYNRTLAETLRAQLGGLPSRVAGSEGRPSRLLYEVGLLPREGE